MEKYAVSVAPISENRQPITRSQWKRCLTELNGKLRRNDIHDVSPLLMQSYSEIGAFPHKINRVSPCQTHEFYSFAMIEMLHPGASANCNQLGVSALEFDTKGIYLASVTRPGCLTVHQFESLYCQNSEEDVGKQWLHIYLCSGVSAVRWNPANQDEVACTSLSNNEVWIFDINYMSSECEPNDVLRTRPMISVHTTNVRKGLSDLALFDDDARILASDTYGTISIWDRRVSDLPQAELTTNANSSLTSIQLYENQCVYGATKNGFIHVWDLRGGKSSAAFQSHTQSASPLTTIKLASLLNKIGPLKAQSNILPKEIHSININPSCHYQLAFHIDDGWSGVLDTHNYQVSHIHCPPPAWLGETSAAFPEFSPRKPSWLPEHSIYAVGSTSSNGLHLLDFYPNTSSPCHVDYDDSKSPKETFQPKQNIFVPLSERVTACATHPLNGTIVAGTIEASLLMISQKHRSYMEEDDGDNEKGNVNVNDSVAAGYD